ncbi:MAG: hypothetical protein Fur0041_10230 [Bacteroidia bacterium]
MKKIFTPILLAFALASYAQQGGPACNNIYISIPSGGQYLYFSSDRHSPGGNYEIYRTDLDGQSNLVRLTNTSVNNLYASLSPDGSKIVWQQGDYGSSAEIWMMNADGTGQVRLTNNNVHDGYPNFSPDGQTIIFESWDNDPYPEIFTMDLSGNNRTQITNLPGADWQCNPIYNPSGTLIYFSKGYNADNHLVRMNLDGTNWVDITPMNPFGTSDGYMHFSPDGQKIVFLSTERRGYNDGSDIFIADTTGANWDTLTFSTGEWNYAPFWHPTNNKIYFSSNGGTGSYEIREMSTTGSNMLTLSNCSLVGMEEENKTIVKIYPNPGSTVLNIESDEPVITEMYDVSGRLVLYSDMRQINVASLDAGLYTVVIRDKSFNVVTKARWIRN